MADAAQAVPRQAPRGRAAKVAPARAATRGSPARATARAVPTATADEVPAVPARSEDGSFCWYASWLYAEKRQGFGYGILPGFPHDEVWLSKDRKCLVLRRATGADVVLSSSPTPCEWHQMPPFSGPLTGEPAERFSFGIFPNEFLEIWTRISATAVEGGKGLWHLIDMATGGREHGANIPLWLWYWGKAVSAGFGEPLPSRITREAGADLGAKFLFSPLPSWLAVLFGSIEGHHSDAAFKNQFTYWLTLLGSDALTAWDAHTWLTRFHDLVLSTFTLLNQKPEVSGEKLACNWQHGGPYSQLGSFLAMYVMVVTKSRDDYSFPFSFFDGKNAYQALWFLVLAPLFSTIGSAVGTLVSFALSRQLHGGLFAEQLGRGALRGLRDYHLLEYQHREGDSDGGRYNPKFDTNGNVISPARIDFGGYPPASASPYKLPYEKGKQLFAGQANMGAFSHMRFAGRPQIYAYDFAHDFGEEILCSRPGTVVDYFDWMPDDKNLSSAAGDRTELDAALVEASALTVVDATSGATVPVLIAGQSGNGGDPPTMANFVMVRHDTRDDVHDRSQSSAPVFTFSKYMHGRKDGVRDAFAQRGIQPHQIIGSTVQQGHLVMLAGDTGLSFHNHLHMEVLGSTANSQGTATVALGVGPPISMNSLTNFTLPFVFSEVKNILHTDGVPWHLNWYESDNVKVP